jgi:hypothetical protein
MIRFRSTRSLERLVLSALSLIGGAALAVGTASATQIFHPGANNCNTDNCNAVILGGTINSVTNSRSVPWTIEVFAGANQCLRLSVSQTGTQQDLEMVVVQPNGTVRRDDNSGSAGCATCPVVKFVTNNTGWHSVSISRATGTPAERDFSLAYGLYTNAGNANCANPTPGQ